MSEESNNFRLIKDKPRSKKLNPKIDLAAMISVSFLLIIFFRLTKELARPQAMDLGISGCGEGGCGPEPGCRLMDHRRQMTLLLDDNNKIIGYRGILEVPDEKPKVFEYGKNGIRAELIRLNREIPEMTGYKEKGTIVLIKPSKKSNYGNLVDILDEMAITQIRTYAIINDFTPEEQKLLASK